MGGGRQSHTCHLKTHGKVLSPSNSHAPATTRTKDLLILFHLPLEPLHAPERRLAEPGEQLACLVLGPSPGVDVRKHGSQPEAIKQE